AVVYYPMIFTCTLSCFFFSSRRRHTRSKRDWSSDVCSSDLKAHICHVSHPAVAKKIKAAQDEGYDITAETCTHYLTFTDEDVIKIGRASCRERVWVSVVGVARRRKG